MEWIGCVRCQKSGRDFVAWTFALIAPVHTVLHQLSCSYETITNASKHYETYENMSLGSVGVDWVHSLQKIPKWLHGTNFYINCTSSPCFASSFMELRNDPKCNQTLCNTPKHEIGVGLIGCVHCEKSRRDFVARTFALIAPVHPVLHRGSCSYETLTNAPKHYITQENMSLGSNGVDWVCSLRKIPMWLRGTNFCINCTSSPYFASSFIQLWNDPKCAQTLCNTPKHEFMVQWGGLGAFVVKNPYVTSWHELLN